MRHKVTINVLVLDKDRGHVLKFTVAVPDFPQFAIALLDGLEIPDEGERAAWLTRAHENAEPTLQPYQAVCDDRLGWLRPRKRLLIIEMTNRVGVYTVYVYRKKPITVGRDTLSEPGWLAAFQSLYRLYELYGA